MNINVLSIYRTSYFKRCTMDTYKTIFNSSVFQNIRRQVRLTIWIHCKAAISSRITEVFVEKKSILVMAIHQKNIKIYFVLCIQQIGCLSIRRVPHITETFHFLVGEYLPP